MPLMAAKKYSPQKQSSIYSSTYAITIRKSKSANKSGKKWNIANKFAYVKKKQYFCALICVGVRLRAGKGYGI